jgi:hypothetical protein
MSGNSDESPRAGSVLSTRDIVRLTELVREIGPENRDYRFDRLLNEVRTIAEYCAAHAFDDFDLIERVIRAMFSPHSSRFRPLEMEYMMAMLALEGSSLEGRVIAIEKLVLAKSATKAAAV